MREMPLALSVLPLWFVSWVKSRISKSQAHSCGYVTVVGPWTRYLIFLLLYFLMCKMEIIIIFYFISPKTHSPPHTHFNTSVLRPHLIVSQVLWIIVAVIWHHLRLLVFSLRGGDCSVSFLVPWCEFRLQWMCNSLWYRFSGEFVFPLSPRNGIGTFKFCSYCFLQDTFISCLPLQRECRPLAV